MSAPQTPQTPGIEAGTPTSRKFAFAIEAGDELGRNPDFAPLKKQLRGRWSKDVFKHGNKGTEALMKMPDIPGIIVEIDTERRAGRIYDPLSGDSRLLAEATGPYKAMMNATPEAWKETVYKDLSDGDLKTWVFWMWRMISDPTPAARLHKGTPPRNLAEIEAMPGKTRIEHYNSSARAVKTREDAAALAEKIGYV